MDNKGKETRFKKGISGNPGGQRKLPPDVKIAKDITQDNVILMFSEVMLMDEFQIKDLLANPKENKFKRAIAQVLDKAEKYGDATRLEFLLNRTIGKVTDRIEHQGLDLTCVVELPYSGGRLVMGAKVGKKE